MQEIEIKYHLSEEDYQILMKAFDFSAQTKDVVYETNALYEGNNLSIQDEVLRVRIECTPEGDERYILTHKSKAMFDAEGNKSRVEVEVPTKSGISAILNNLGYKTNIVYKKHRTNYSFKEQNNVVVSLDKLDFGYYMEIEEIIPNDGNSIKEFVKHWNINAKIERRPYPTLMELDSLGLLTSKGKFEYNKY